MMRVFALIVLVAIALRIATGPLPVGPDGVPLTAPLEALGFAGAVIAIVTGVTLIMRKRL